MGIDAQGASDGEIGIALHDLRSKSLRSEEFDNLTPSCPRLHAEQTIFHSHCPQFPEINVDGVFLKALLPHGMPGSERNDFLSLP